MAYDPEVGLRYCAEQRAKRRAEEEKKLIDEDTTELLMDYSHLQAKGGI